MLNQTAKLVYQSTMPIRWYDMDAFGHVNTSVYFTYFEQTRINWWIEMVPGPFKLEETGPVVVQAACTFLKSIVYPETIIVKLFVAPPGRRSYETFYQICSQRDEKILYAEGSAKIVWVDRKAGRAIPLPDELRRLLMEKIEI